MGANPVFSPESHAGPLSSDVHSVLEGIHSVTQCAPIEQDKRWDLNTAGTWIRLHKARWVREPMVLRSCVDSVCGHVSVQSAAVLRALP